MKTSGAGSRRRLLAPALALWVLAVSAAGERPPEKAQFQALPLQRSRQNHLLVRAQINGRPAVLGVDSGAPVSGIALSRRKHFRITRLPHSSELPAELLINGGHNEVAIAHRLQLGAMVLVDEPLVVVDLNGSTRAAQEFDEQELDGIIGADILFPTEAVLDCRRQILFMKVDPDAQGPLPGIDHRGWSSVPIRVSRGWNLYVDSKLNGKPAQLMLDTGAFMTLIHGPFLDGMHLKVHDTDFMSGAVNLDDRAIQLATIKRFAVGSLVMNRYLIPSYTVNDKEVAVMNLTGLIQDSSLQASPPVAGLLGSEFLRRNHGIIDFGARKLYLKL